LEGGGAPRPPNGAEQLDDRGAQESRIVVAWGGLIDDIGVGHADMRVRQRGHLGADVVGPRHRIRTAGTVDQHDVDQAGADVPVQRGDVVGDAEGVGLTLLLGHVAHVDLERVAGAHGLRDAIYKQVRQHAGEEAARTKHDDVGLQQGAHSFGVSLGVLGSHEDVVQGRRVMLDRRLAVDDRAIGQARVQRQVGQRRGQDLALYAQDAACFTDGRLEVAGNAAHGRDVEVAERVPFQVRPLGETILQQLLHQRAGLGQRRDAVTEVARRQDRQLAA